MKLTPKEAATRIGVSVSLVYEWCAQKRLRHYRFGGKGKRGRILIEESDLAAFLESCLVDPSPVLQLRHLDLGQPVGQLPACAERCPRDDCNAD